MYKQTILIMTILSSTMLLAGCIGGTAAVDCGSDLQCFIDNAKTCTPAVARYTIEGLQGSTARQEIQGGTLENCKLYIKYETMPEGMESLEGLEATCTFNVNEKMSVIQSTSSFDYTNYWTDIEACSGSLIDAREQFISEGTLS